MPSPQRKKHKVRDLIKALSIQDFVRKVVAQYCSATIFHYRWFKLEDIAQNIMNYFYIDKALSITVDHINHKFLRQQHIKLALDLPQGIANNIGMYRAHYFDSGGVKVFIYQTTPIGDEATNYVQDFSKVVESHPLRVLRNQKRQLDEICNTVAQKRIMDSLGISETGIYEFDSDHLSHNELKSEPTTQSDDQASQPSCVSMMNMSLNAIGSNTAQYDYDDDMTLSSGEESQEIYEFPPNDWWYGEYAIKLFSTDPEKKDPYNELSQRIDVLQNALKNKNGYKNIVRIVNSNNSTGNESIVNDSTMNDADDDKDDICLSDYQIYCVKQRTLYVLSALKYAKQHMNNWSWSECCDEVIKSCNQGREGTSLEYTKCGRSIQRWHVDFRKD